MLFLRKDLRALPENRLVVIGGKIRLHYQIAIYNKILHRLVVEEIALIERAIFSSVHLVLACHEHFPCGCRILRFGLLSNSLVPG